MERRVDNARGLTVNISKNFEITDTYSYRDPLENEKFSKLNLIKHCVLKIL